MARLALSLIALRSEVDDAFPGRSTASDGWIGNEAHQQYDSRHNPNDWDVVTALDITHDPASGCDIHAIARTHVLDPHPELEYVISNREIAKRSTGFRWEPYRRSNPHTLHAHFAVGRGPDGRSRPPYDSTQPWGIAPQEDDDMIRDGDDIRDLQEDLNWIVVRWDPNQAKPFSRLREDGICGDKTIGAMDQVRALWGRRSRGQRPSAQDVSKVDRLIHEMQLHGAVPGR